MVRQLDKLGFGEILVLTLCFFFVFGGAMLPKLAKRLGELEEEIESEESEEKNSIKPD